MSKHLVRPAPASRGRQVVELRRYTRHPQQRDLLFDLFDREFVESQEVLDATVFHLKGAAEPELIEWVRERMTTTLRQGGARVLSWYVSEPSANDFPRQPVREGEHVPPGLAMSSDAATMQAFAASGAWQRDIDPLLSRFLRRRPQSTRLAPTSRSAVDA